MNGFRYVENEKKIIIADEKNTVTWVNVEKDVAVEAGKMFNESKNIDDFLHQHNCKRSWS